MVENVAARGSTCRTPRAADGARTPQATTAGELGDRCRSHARPNSRQTSIARTRQVTVAKIICGVDVSSFSLEACIGPEGPTRSFPNTADGIAELTIFCRQHGVELVAMEATGGYEKQPLALLWARGLPVALLNPRAVRRFAEGMGLLEKTDRIDAGVIAWFAAVKRSVPCTLVSAEQDQLKALITRLRQLTELQTAQRNQRLLVSGHRARLVPRGLGPGGFPDPHLRNGHCRVDRR